MLAAFGIVVAAAVLVAIVFVIYLVFLASEFNH